MSSSFPVIFDLRGSEALSTGPSIIPSFDFRVFVFPTLGILGTLAHFRHFSFLPLFP